MWDENENVILSCQIFGWQVLDLASTQNKDELDRQQSMMQLFRILGITQALPPYMIHPDFKTLTFPLSE